MIFEFSERLSRRAMFSLSHLLLSLLIAGAAAFLVFRVWYPYPYRIVSGGQSLFFILIAVDVILGPLITVLVATPKKPKNTLTKDLMVIGIFQTAALLYGMATVFEARPVHTVFERDRFQVVHAVDIPQGELDAAPVGIDQLPITGPTLLSLRAFRNIGEESELTFQSTVGITLAAQPSMWIPLERDTVSIIAKAKPIGTLRSLFPQRKREIDDAVAKSKLPETQLGYLPLVSRQAFWTVLIDTKTAKPAAYLDLDPYEVTTAK